MRSFYVDTCVYLNLWKKEKGSIFGRPLWLITKKFLDKIISQNHTIYYSGFILKELLNKLSTEEYLNKRQFFEDNTLFRKVMLTKEEHEKAIAIKKNLQTNCSLSDIIHIMLAKKTNSILITQDKELLNLSNRNKVLAKTPAEIINY